MVLGSALSSCFLLDSGTPPSVPFQNLVIMLGPLDYLGHTPISRPFLNLTTSANPFSICQGSQVLGLGHGTSMDEEQKYSTNHSTAPHLCKIAENHKSTEMESRSVVRSWTEAGRTRRMNPEVINTLTVLDVMVLSWGVHTSELTK